jgi:hypothetical protein
MREIRTSGSVRGLGGNAQVYSATPNTNPNYERTCLP